MYFLARMCHHNTHISTSRLDDWLDQHIVGFEIETTDEFHVGVDRPGFSTILSYWRGYNASDGIGYVITSQIAVGIILSATI